MVVGAGGTYDDATGDITLPAGGGAVGINQMVAGGYYHSAHQVSATYDTFAPEADTTYFSPLVVDEATPIDRLCIKVATAGGAGEVIRMGIYRAARGVPIGAPVCEASVPATVVAIHQAEVSVTLTPGLYLMALVTQGGTLRIRSCAQRNDWRAETPAPAGDWFGSFPAHVARRAGAVATAPLPDGSAFGAAKWGHGAAHGDIVQMMVRAA